MVEVGVETLSAGVWVLDEGSLGAPIDESGRLESRPEVLFCLAWGAGGELQEG